MVEVRHSVAAIAALLVLAWLPVAGASESGNNPTAVVERFHTALISVMQAATLTDKQAIAGDAVIDTFHVETIARISLGRNWRTIPPEAQQDYANLLQELIATTYASRFKNYDDQVFETVATADLSRDRKQVRTTLTTKTETVSFDYALVSVDGKWQVYDVVANGVSDLSLKRSNYTSLFKTGGIAAVTDEIAGNILRNRNGDAE